VATNKEKKRKGDDEGVRNSADEDKEGGKKGRKGGKTMNQPPLRCHKKGEGGERVCTLVIDYAESSEKKKKEEGKKREQSA